MSIWSELPKPRFPPSWLRPELIYYKTGGFFPTNKNQKESYNEKSKTRRSHVGALPHFERLRQSFSYGCTDWSNMDSKPKRINLAQVGRGRRAETNGRSLNESNRFWTFRAFRFRRREISLRSFSNALSLFIAQAPLTPRPERTHGDNAKSNIEPKATGPFNVLKRGGVGWVFYV